MITKMILMLAATTISLAIGCQMFAWNLSNQIQIVSNEKKALSKFFRNQAEKLVREHGGKANVLNRKKKFDTWAMIFLGIAAVLAACFIVRYLPNGQ